MNKQSQLTSEEMEVLNAYLDDALSDKEKARFELLVQNSAHIKQTLESFRNLRWNLRHLPKRKVPHHFVLTRAEAQAIKRRKAWFPIFGSASLASLLVLSMMFILPVFGAKSSPVPTSLAVQPQARSFAQPQIESAPSSEEVPSAPSPMSAKSEASSAEVEPLAAAPALEGSADSSASLAQVFFFASQGRGGGLGGGGLGGANSQNDKISAAVSYSPSQVKSSEGSYNYNNFGNAPIGLVIPSEPLFGSALATYPSAELTPSIAIESEDNNPLILGLDPENAGKIIEMSPMMVQTESKPTVELSEPAATVALPAEITNLAENPAADVKYKKQSNLILLAKLTAGLLALIFAGLALYFKKH
ncbi:MAG: hypothetical protein VB108_07645 [Anaerolineaceae bacterium]|nr:hypothetical protein [Anaerolineaceae bacterium]